MIHNRAALATFCATLAAPALAKGFADRAIPSRRGLCKP